MTTNAHAGKFCAAWVMTARNKTSCDNHSSFVEESVLINGFLGGDWQVNQPVHTKSA